MVKSSFEQKKREAISEFLCGGRFLIAGTAAWYGQGLDLGQTVIYVTTHVYNETVEGMYQIKNIPGRFEFIKTRFPQTPDIEFWVVDMINNYLGMDVSVPEVMYNLNNYLQVGKINRAKLIQNNTEFGLPATRYLIEEVLRGEVYSSDKGRAFGSLLYEQIRH
ncbi:isopentenyl-diphosphate delta-isomerase [Acrasis kona]|uniref:Isopentenyl-diphosphate delta-isomerase n=1 Tax=Acrasis kona TaxID=1008807 RepID=A0AAW2ZQK2_9EUKA